MSDNITEEHQMRLGWIIEAAKKDELALFEVTDKAGEPAVLMVAFDRDEMGKGGRMAPLARIDVDLVNGFTPPEGVEQVTDEGDGVLCEDECADVCNNREEDDKAVDKAGVGC